jgi:hypothetical protein
MTVAHRLSVVLDEAMRIVCSIVLAVVVAAASQEPVMNAKVVAIKTYQHGHITSWNDRVPSTTVDRSMT